MQPHTKNYREFFEIGDTDTFLCEVPSCNQLATQIHHIVPRSKFGSRRKEKQDEVANLIGLCLTCHRAAHEATESVEHANQLTKIHLKNMELARVACPVTVYLTKAEIEKLKQNYKKTIIVN